MRARWVSPMPSPKFPLVGYTHVASWWPGQYKTVMTFFADRASSQEPLAILTRSISPPEKIKNVYVTIVCKSDKYGMSVPYGWNGSNKNHLYESETLTLEDAQEEHQRVVYLLADGKKLTTLK